MGLGDAGGKNLLEEMGEGPVGWDGFGEGGISTVLYTEFQRELGEWGWEATLLRAQRTGRTVRIKEADGIPRVGVQRDRKNPDMSSHVCVFVQSLCVPQEPTPPPKLC